MHNTQRMVISNIHHSIPMEILNICFNPNNKQVSIDQLIWEKVVTDRVQMDCNLVGGVRKNIILTHDMLERTNPTQQEASMMMMSHALYRIPEEVRDYRPIVSVISVNYPAHNGAFPFDYMRPTRGANATKLSRAVIESHTMSSAMVTPTAVVRDGDLIKLTPGHYGNIQWLVSCNLAYDEAFSDLNQHAVLAFMDLTLCSVKSYIYNRMTIVIDQARILHGSEQGSIRDTITKYEGEEEKYKELLGEFTGGAQMETSKQMNLLSYML